MGGKRNISRCSVLSRSRSINTIYDLWIHSWYLQLIQLICNRWPPRGNMLPITSTKNPNRTWTQNCGFFPISSLDRVKHLWLDEPAGSQAVVSTARRCKCSQWHTCIVFRSKGQCFLKLLWTVFSLSVSAPWFLPDFTTFHCPGKNPFAVKIADHG